MATGSNEPEKSLEEMKRISSDGSRAPKSAGSDERKKKATYPSLHGLPASRQRARELIDETKRLLLPLGPAADPIRALADFVFERRS